MKQEQWVKKLTNLAVAYLAIRNRSREELTGYLRRKTDNEEVLTQVIAWVDEFNLLNDAQFAREWTQSRLKKGKGAMAIRQELKQKGIAPELILTTIALIPQEEWETSAKAYLTKKRLLWQKYTGFARIGKMRHLLASRGFDGKTANAVIDGLGGEEVQ